MSQLSSSTSPTRSKPGGPFRKPRADVFTMLLLISLVALILGIICLYAEMEAYQWEFKGGPTITSMAAPAEPGLAAVWNEPRVPLLGTSSAPLAEKPLLLRSSGTPCPPTWL